MLAAHIPGENIVKVVGISGNDITYSYIKIGDRRKTMFNLVREGLISNLGYIALKTYINELEIELYISKSVQKVLGNKLDEIVHEVLNEMNNSIPRVTKESDKITKKEFLERLVNKLYSTFSRVLDIYFEEILRKEINYLK